MTEKLATLLTTAEAAEYLGVTVERILYWARDGLLRVAAQTEAGDLLFRRYVLDTLGEDLAALAPVHRPRKRRQEECEHLRISLLCGCCPSRSVLHLCPTGAGLLAALQLAEGFATAAPSDRLLAKLAGLCRDALARHLAGPPSERSGPPPHPPLPLEVVAAIERLEGREPDSGEVVGGECASAEGAEPSLSVRPMPCVASAPANETADREVRVT